MTGQSLRLHEDADLELNDAADYYDRESPGLGSTFLDEVDSGFDRQRPNVELAQRATQDPLCVEQGVVQVEAVDKVDRAVDD